MSLSSNSIIVIIIKADSQRVLKVSKTSSLLLSLDLSLTFQFDKLRIFKKIPGKTLVILENQGNNDYSNLKASRYFDHSI